MIRKPALLMLLALLLVVLPAAGDGLSLDEVIAKNIEARGGEDAIKKIQSVRMTGTLSMPAMGVEAPMSVEMKRPNRVRMEMTMQGMTMIQAYDGETGWAIMPMFGKPDPEKMADDQLKQILEYADFDGPLIDRDTKGNTVELVGLEEIEGTEAYRLKITRENGDVIHSFIDSEYFLEFRQEAKTNVQGTEMEAATILGDYKEVGGLMMPHSIETALGGGPTFSTITIQSIDLDPELADNKFSMPEKKADAPSTTGE